MTIVVADASVIVRWMLPQRGEVGLEAALGLLQEIKDGQTSLREPPHWLAEVAAVVTRLSPATAVDDVADLLAMEIETADAPEIYLTACALARDTNQHVFDTLYHAVALNLPNTVLVTADERYYRRAVRLGRIVLLSEYRPH